MLPIGGIVQGGHRPGERHALQKLSVGHLVDLDSTVGRPQRELRSVGRKTGTRDFVMRRGPRAAAAQ